MILYYFPIAQNTVNKTVSDFLERSYVALILLFFYLLVRYQSRLKLCISCHRLHTRMIRSNTLMQHELDKLINLPAKHAKIDKNSRRLVIYRSLDHLHSAN